MPKCISTNATLYSEKAQVLGSHTLNAHHIWNARILETKTEFGVWQEHSLEDAVILDQTNIETSMAIIAQKELQSVFKYTNSKGSPFQNKIQDTLFHIINHSTYHRGQLMSELKQLGYTPIATHYIVYKQGLPRIIRSFLRNSNVVRMALMNS